MKGILGRKIGMTQVFTESGVTQQKQRLHLSASLEK